MAYCPKCKQTFAEGGFCPYDGATLHVDETIGPPKATQQGNPPQSPTTPFDQQANPNPATEPGFTSPRDLKALSAMSAMGSGGDHAAALSKLRSNDPKAEYDRLVGATLDNRYLIEKKLGEGGMGVVFLAKHTIIEKAVAIKVLKREVARDHSVVKRFVQEAKAASRIGHPNIVDVTDFGTTPDGMTYSVMEFVDGQTLSQVIKAAAPMDLSRALPVIAQLAKALGAAHDKGIVHRDLKPENVFLIDRDGRPDFVKVVDFGIAKIMPLEDQGPAAGPRLTRAGTVFGTPEYMAPEQAAGRSDTDRRVDIYALGTILYEMIVGKVPHKGPTMVRTLAMQMLDPIEPPSKTRPELDISQAFEDVLMKALAKNRDERYDTMEVFLADLEKVSAVPLAIPLSPKSAPINVGRLGASDRTMIEGGALPSTLPELPPGANAEKLAAEARPDQAVTNVVPKRKRASSSIDPAFIDGAPAFEHVFDNPPIDRDQSSKWPIVVTVLILLAGGAYGAYWLSQRGDDKRANSSDPVVKTYDAATPIALATDAGPAKDAGMVIAEITPDARRRTNVVRPWRKRTPDAGTKIIGRGEDVMIRINTRPEGARIYISGVYRGTSQDGGIAISNPFGSRILATCKLPGYRDGRVVLTFNKKRFSFDCIMQRIKKCVPGLKNPFDACPKKKK